VQDGAVLARVDVVAGEHRGDTVGEAALGREREQQTDRLVGDEVLAVVHVEIGGLPGEAAAAVGVPVEQVTQAYVANVVGVRRQRVPCLGGRRVGSRRVGGHRL